jgi:transcriptional regulator with XRE-family HTH domain
MEHEMKVSASVIKKLRTERGWSQEQLAIASGVSLRTIQRVEAEGIASTSTAVCIAATYGVKLIELQGQKEGIALKASTIMYGLKFLGTALITIAFINESGRLPGFQSDAFASINIFIACIGTLILIPAYFTIFKNRKFVGAILTTLGVPLLTLSICGLVYALVSGKDLNWILIVFGGTGLGLISIAIKEFRRSESKAILN